MDRQSHNEYDLPGFRFHPTDEELLGFYLKREASGKAPQCDIIGTVELYAYDPWELPGMANIGEREWYFFVSRNNNNMNRGRPNRIAKSGFWKATGLDREIRSKAEQRRIIGLKKTLVYYTGKAPKGCKTDWIMNEYRMPENCPLKKDMVLCKIYRKATPQKLLERQALQETVVRVTNQVLCYSASDTASSEQELSANMGFKPEFDHKDHDVNNFSSLRYDTDQHQEIACGSEVSQDPMSVFGAGLTELQLTQTNLDWIQDLAFSELYSPWMDIWSPDNILIEALGSQISPNLCFEPPLQWD